MTNGQTYGEGTTTLGDDWGDVVRGSIGTTFGPMSVIGAKTCYGVGTKVGVMSPISKGPILMTSSVVK